MINRVDWDSIVKEVEERNMWKINKRVLTHDPYSANGYFAKEVELLKDLGYSFKKEGSTWRAYK